MTLFTIGHSTAELRDLIEVLVNNGVEIVADVRSKPRSRLPHFDQYPLQTAMEEAGMRYRFLGGLLGGVPSDPRIAARWRQGRLDPVIIGHLRSTDEWREGLAELTGLMTSRGGARVCVLCSEADPNECHRKAVALDAAELVPSTEVVHLSIHKTAPREVGVQEVLL